MLTIPPPCLLLFHILFSAGLLFPLFLPSDSSLAAFDRDSGERWKEVHGAAKLEGRRLIFTAKAGTVTTCMTEK